MYTESSIANELLERLRRLTVIDAHAHLMPECVQIARHRDALSFYSQYIRLPLLASGFRQETWERIHNPEIDLQERWRMLKIGLPNVRLTSFFQAAQFTLERFGGVSQLTDDNLEEVSARIASESRPGLYHRVLRDACGIRCVVNQDTLRNNERDLEGYREQQLLLPVVSLIDIKGNDGVEVNRLMGDDGFGSLDAYLDWAIGRLERMAADGALGFKSFAIEEVPVERTAAMEQYRSLSHANRELRLDRPSALRTYIHHELLRTVARLGLPVAVHTGFWGVNTYAPTHFIPVIERFPGIHFDLFHAGIPYAREIGTIALNYANASLNLCWAHSSNMSLTAATLREYIDSLGLDKIIGFGSDVHQTVEKVYGHLELARRNIAKVLASRIDDGVLSVDEALEIARLWLYENPKRIYGLREADDSHLTK